MGELKKLLTYGFVMLERQPRGYNIPRIVKIFAFAEGAALVGCYYFWNRMNRSRDYRKYMRDNYPSILNGFYKVGETINSDDQTRQLDIKIWEIQANSEK